ncbi:MAG: RAMP superfamily CRISPR-associated protein [Armatimonadetes bacterium]|nr:RAMP superfamily CRISPR-associated protein [Armatimonadota bacterium]MDW8027317.1 RAMP superfamily CRISPR-associated protein [Armatimonadota bacterium]
MSGTGAKRTFFIGKIKVVGPLHIGLGTQTPSVAPHETDQPVLLDQEGKPYIPATSLGGLMRSFAENIVSVLMDGVCKIW